MDAALAQAQRIGTLATPLGEDVLGLVRFVGTEGLGRLFEYRIDALSDDGDIDFDAAIGRNCSVAMATYGARRIFNGVLVEAQWLGPRDDRYAYALLLRPWFWLLSRTTDCRIFENRTAVEIIKQVFSDRGFSDFSDGTTQSYPSIPYCVQYRETDLDFVCRLMEQYGIYYFFEHAEGAHTLVMADAASSHKPVPGLARLPFIALDGSDRRDREHVHDWSADRRFRTGKVELKDYDYLKPGAKLLSDADGAGGYTRSHMEFYDYPGRYTEQSDGDRFARVRLEAEQAQDRRRLATGDAPSLFPGGLTTLQDQIKTSENIQYLVLGATHSLVTESYRSGATSLPKEIYTGSYEFLPSDRPFRMPLVTPKPLVHGPQTAKVVGKAGEEIDVDEHGRILVQFYWDRKRMKSCRVRIAQAYSGKAWGGIFIPRIDQEVVVEYLEGDPDRPLVTGTVYNNDNRVPYTLPDNKTVGGWKTDSSKGHDGYNELVFDDKAGSEQVRVHAQKNLDTVILNAETREVGKSFQIPIGADSRTTTLHNGDDTLTIKAGNQTTSVAGSKTTTVQLEMATEAGVVLTLKVGMSKITMSQAGITLEAPLLQLNAYSVATIQAPVIDLVGLVNVTGGLLIDGQPPMMA